MIKLGNISLDKYVHEPAPSTAPREEVISGLIERLRSNKTPQNEIFPIKKMLIEEMQYPALDTSFLSMHNTINYEGFSLPAPVFSVYRANENGFSPFSVTYQIFSNYKRLRFSPISSCSFLTGSLSPIIWKHLEESTQDWFNYPGGVLKDYWRRGFCTKKVILSSEFHGIIPKETKEKMRTAKEIFGKDVYLLAETKPEEWNTTLVNKDPLLVGTFDKCYLIDHFETTSREEYIRKEFSV